MPATYIDRPGIFKRQAREERNKRDKEWRMEDAVAVSSVRCRASACIAGGYVSPRFALPRHCLTSAVETAHVGCLTSEGLGRDLPLGWDEPQCWMLSRRVVS